VDTVFDRHLEAGAEDRLVALRLPELHVKRAIQIFDFAGPNHHTDLRIPRAVEGVCLTSASECATGKCANRPGARQSNRFD